MIRTVINVILPIYLFFQNINYKLKYDLIVFRTFLSFFGLLVFFQELYPFIFGIYFIFKQFWTTFIF